MSTPEPSTIRPPPSLSAFHHPSLKFLCLGRYVSGLAGEKEKVICIIKPNIVIASVRGTLTKQMALSTIVSIHHQDSTDFLPEARQQPQNHSATRFAPSAGTTPSSISEGKVDGTPTYCDMVITDIDKQVLAFSIPKQQLFSFLGVALYYAPPNTPVHEVRGKVSLLESLASLSRRQGDDVFGSFIQSLQHLGQDDRLERLQSVRTYDAAARNHSAASLSTIMSVAESSPMDEGLPELLTQLQEDEVGGDTGVVDPAQRTSGVAPLRLTSSPKVLPKPRPKPQGSPERAAMADSYARGIEHLARHRSAPQDKLSTLARAMPLPGDDELLAWKSDVPGAAETSLIMPSRAALNVSSLARPIFGKGGTIVFPTTTKEQAALARREELQTVAGVMAELKRMQSEIAEIKKHRNSSGRDMESPSHTSAAPAPHIASSDDDDDDDDDSEEADGGTNEKQRRSSSSPRTDRSVSASSSSAAASALAGSAPRDQQHRLPPRRHVANRSSRSPQSSPRERPVTDTVADNVRSSLLPLLSASTQQAAVRALDELSTIQRELEETSKVHMNPFVLRQIEAMKQPLRTLHRLVAPAKRAVGAADSIDQLQAYASLSGDLVPVWALVDFGEVNYDQVPLMLKQYHRLIARKVDDEGMYHILIATRMQFAADEGYILVPFSSILDIALGALPRPVRAQRLTVDGRVGNSDEFLDSKSCLSLRTRLQHILFQFESVEDCRQWATVLQEVVLENKRGATGDRSAVKQSAVVDKEDL